MATGEIHAITSAATITAQQVRTSGFKPAPRIQDSALSAIEKKVLLWLAERTPAWVNSDYLTLIGFFGQVMAGVSYVIARSHRWGLVLATVFLALNWFGDSLDGTLARFRNKQRPRYGF
ncbi:MAG TPA: CDP-alcohol phosphatidyltransferase family protein, partial [Terriglobales bacterium]|nr:CDP-alcohol phosphatidyltransferase family protein [Terriglobales bacterium]